jgi:large subunit ribosomal protein L9
MRQSLLLLKDVDGLGNKGDVVRPRSGHTRNYLLPKRLAVVASAHTLRKQEKLKAERDAQAIVDRKEADELSLKLASLNLETSAKVDPEGHMYGSVSAGDIAELLQAAGYPIERRFVRLPKPIKVTGAHKIALVLKEQVAAEVLLTIHPEGGEKVLPGQEKVTAPLPKEEAH